MSMAKNINNVLRGTDRFGRACSSHDMICYLEAVDEQGHPISTRVPVRMEVHSVGDGLSLVPTEEVTLDIKKSGTAEINLHLTREMDGERITVLTKRYTGDVRTVDFGPAPR